MLSPFHTTALFLYPQKHKKLLVFWYFQVVKKDISDMERVKVIQLLQEVDPSGIKLFDFEKLWNIVSEICFKFDPEI